MIDFLRTGARGFVITSCQLVDLLPVRQQPCLEVMECHMRMESWLCTNPFAHLFLCIFCRWELRWGRARIDVSQCNDGIGWLLFVIQKILNNSFQLVTSRNPSI